MLMCMGYYRVSPRSGMSLGAQFGRGKHENPVSSSRASQSNVYVADTSSTPEWVVESSEVPAAFADHRARDNRLFVCPLLRETYEGELHQYL